MPSWTTPSRSSRSPTPASRAVHRALLEHAGAHPLLDVLAAARLEHDGLDPVQVQQVGEQQAGRAGADDADLGVYPHTSSAVSTIRRSLATSGRRGERVALDGRGEPALRRQAELVERDVPRRLLDPPLQLVLVLELAALRGHEPEHDELARRHEAQRLEAAGAGVVVLEEEAVDLELAEQRLGDEVVAALGHPRGAEVAAAHVGRDRHALGAAGERLVDVADVALVQVLGVAALIGDHARAARIVEVGEARVVELQVRAAELAEPRAPAPRRRP